MSTNDLADTRDPERTVVACVVVAAERDDALAACLSSLREHTPSGVAVEVVGASVSELNHALERLGPADVVILDPPCRVASGWIERLAGAAYADTNIASASALTLGEGPLAPPGCESPAEGLDGFARSLVERSQQLRPRLTRAVGPCTFWRREALQLAGSLDEQLGIAAAAELDLAQRCLLAGMTHVAADDVIVESIVRDPPSRASLLDERYPYLQRLPLAESGVLPHALRSASASAGAGAGAASSRLQVTLDARALDGAITGTQTHILELILALARTGAVELRLLVLSERIDEPTRALLSSLPETELLAAETLTDSAPAGAVFHRPQQTFVAHDVELALSLGERFVISQLDLIAYRNPGYFPDANMWQDYRSASRHGLAAAERVVVFSEHTRGELISDALVDAGRIRVVPPGLDHRRPIEQRRPDGLGAEWDGSTEAGLLVCLGTDFRHKNRVFALKLLAALRERHGWRGSLVMAGTHVATGSSAALERDYLLEHSELRGAVISLGPVTEEEKAWLLANASALVYPSVYEGFGLVPFESALAGTPCLFAPYSSLAEAAPQGIAAIVPWDAAASADAAYVLLTDAAARERHLRALAERAQALTWDAAARAMVEIYRQAVAAPPRDAATLSRDLVVREQRHAEVVRGLLGEREHAKRMYDDLQAEVGFGLGLIGPHGALPDPLQRALLALSARPQLSRPLFALLSRAFLAGRALARLRGRITGRTG